MAGDTRVAPVPTALTEPYWNAARSGWLALQRCVNCRAFNHPPAEECRVCHSGHQEFEPVSGLGMVETFSIVHRTFAPGFAERVPYVIAWIALDEQPGLRVFGNVIEVPVDRVDIGMRVEVVFEKIAGFGPVPNFRPSRLERTEVSHVR